MTDMEAKMLEAILDRWTPETKGEHWLHRVSDMERKMKEIMLGFSLLHRKVDGCFKGNEYVKRDFD